MPNTGGTNLGEPVQVVKGDAAATEVAPPSVQTEATGGLAGDIRRHVPEAGQKVEVPVQADASASVEQPDAMAQAQAKINAAGTGTAEEVAPADEPLTVVDGNQGEVDAALEGSRKRGEYSALELKVSQDTDAQVEDVGEGEQLTQSTAVEIKAPEVGTHVAEEPVSAPTEGGVLAGLDESAEPPQSEPQPAPEPAASAEPPAPVAVPAEPIPELPASAVPDEATPVADTDKPQLVVNNNPRWGDKTELLYEIPKGPGDPPKLAKQPEPTEIPYPDPEPPLPEPPAPAIPDEVPPDQAPEYSTETGKPLDEMTFEELNSELNRQIGRVSVLQKQYQAEYRSVNPNAEHTLIDLNNAHDTSHLILKLMGRKKRQNENANQTEQGPATAGGAK